MGLKTKYMRQMNTIPGHVVVGTAVGIGTVAAARRFTEIAVANHKAAMPVVAVASGLAHMGVCWAMNGNEAKVESLKENIESTFEGLTEDPSEEVLNDLRARIKPKAKKAEDKPKAEEPKAENSEKDSEKANAA